MFSFSGQKNENQSTKKVGLSSLHNFASALQPCFPYNDLHRSMRCLSFFCMVAVRDTSTSHRRDDFFCRNFSYQTKSHKNIEITEFQVIKNLVLLLYIINFCPAGFSAQTHAPGNFLVHLEQHNFRRISNTVICKQL